MHGSAKMYRITACYTPNVTTDRIRAISKGHEYAPSFTPTTSVNPFPNDKF